MLNLFTASPKNVANIIIATIFPSAIDATGFDGNNPLKVSTKGVISLSSVSAVATTSVPTPSFITFPTTIPTIAASAVVISNIPNDLNVNFPKSSPSPIFMITLNIDTNTIGTTNIFNRSINPEPNNPYHLVTSCNQVTSAGFSGSPATNCIITPNISPIIVAYIVLVENLTFFFSNCLTIKNVPISTAIKITVFKSVIIRNCDKNELSPIL